MSMGAVCAMVQLQFSFRLAIWLAVVTAAGSWSVTIESADDLVCKGGAGFSKYGTSTPLSLSLSLYLHGTEDCRLRLGTWRRRRTEHTQRLTEQSGRVSPEVPGLGSSEKCSARLPLCFRFRMRPTS
eukprot:COSAG02_NODE_350_length_24063_cov_47.131447_5_plen_127_part_00